MSAAAGATLLTGERFAGGAKAFDESVRTHKGVLVFSKTTCPYCDRVKKAFDAKSIPYAVVELDRVDKAPEIHTELKRLAGIVTLAAFATLSKIFFFLLIGFLCARRTLCRWFSLAASSSATRRRRSAS